MLIIAVCVVMSVQRFDLVDSPIAEDIGYIFVYVCLNILLVTIVNKNSLFIYVTKWFNTV